MEDTVAAAVKLLQEKYTALKRLPVKGDFDDVQVCRIKGALGPWPRALEKAGLKPAPERRQSKPHPHGRRARRAMENNKEETT